MARTCSAGYSSLEARGVSNNKDDPMTFMIIEHFHPQRVKALYERLDREGRVLPPGINYLNSWIDESVSTCYQVMEAPSLEQLSAWTKRWEDYADFEIIPVIDSQTAKARVLGKSF